MSATFLGRLIDSFVTAQLRAELPTSRHDPRLYHLRDANGRREVDLVIELADGRVIAVEVKADSAPDAGAARNLFWLAEQLGEHFIDGIVFHTGARRIPFADTVIGLPICALWGPTSA